ncbi:MAG TPA: hypothetical protein VF738_03665 [Rhodanobacter sp.]
MSAHWHEVRFGEVDVRAEGDQWRFHVHVYLGDVRLERVRVELYAEAGDGLPAACIPMHGGEPIVGSIGGHAFAALAPATRAADRYTARVRPWHEDAFLPAELPLVLWQR